MTLGMIGGIYYEHSYCLCTLRFFRAQPNANGLLMSLDMSTRARHAERQTSLHASLTHTPGFRYQLVASSNQQHRRHISSCLQLPRARTYHPKRMPRLPSGTFGKSLYMGEVLNFACASDSTSLSNPSNTSMDLRCRSYGTYNVQVREDAR
jgi:hypothetical protein